MTTSRTAPATGAPGRVATWLAGWARRVEARRRTRLQAESLVAFAGA